MEPITYHEIPCSALIQGGRGLVLSQLGVPDFADSPREALPPLRSERRRAGDGEGEGTGASM